MNAAFAALLDDYYKTVWPENDGEPITVEWIRFVPHGPVFAITDWPKMTMLVEYDDAAH